MEIQKKQKLRQKRRKSKGVKKGVLADGKTPFFNQMK